MPSLLERLVLCACALMLACTPAGRGIPPPIGQALRARFPAQAARVLAAPRAFTAAADGFSARPHGGMRVDLPRRGEGALRFSLGPGVELRVREVGAAGDGMTADRAVVYARRGGASFWAAEEDGYEEWLLLEPPAVRRDAPVAAWEIEGAAVRQRGEAVDIVDTSGHALIAVTAPEAFAAGGRPIAARLTAHGQTIELWVDAEGERVLVDPAWRRARPMQTPRADHTATRLRDGRVLVVGGHDEANHGLQSVEAYDPRTHVWTAVASTLRVRDGHAATLLGDGRVLVTGGTAELYDADADAWTLVAGPLDTGNTATLLHDGRVLAAAGAQAAVYDPVTDTWTTVGSMNDIRTGHTATLLQNGRVLVAGGKKGEGILSSAESFNSSIGQWFLKASMSTNRSAHTATLLDDGRVLVVGGDPEAEIYLPNVGNSGAWTVLHQSTSDDRAFHTATPLDGNRVLVAGGDLFGSAELYDGKSGTPTRVEPMTRDRSHHTATPLDDGTVLVTGGLDSRQEISASAELYDPKGYYAWTPIASMRLSRDGHTATPLDDGRVLVAGGLNDGAFHSEMIYLRHTLTYDLNKDTWDHDAEMSAARRSHAAVKLEDGRVLVAGGENGDGIIADAEVYDPATDKWAPTGSMILARSYHTATRLHDGRVLVAGGQSVDGALADVELYDPATDTWAHGGWMTAARASHTATRLDDGRVLVAGGMASADRLASAEVYDPGTGTWAPVESMASRRVNHAATLLDDGRVLVTGGKVVYRLLGAEAFDPKTGKWTTVASTSAFGWERPTAVKLEDGRVLVAGGNYLGDDAQATAAMYDPKADTWMSVAWLKTPRKGHTATLIGGRVLVMGGVNGDGRTATAEMFSLQRSGGACTDSRECQSGSCLDAICCDSSCNVGCATCSVANGAPSDGACTVLIPCGTFACDTSKFACFTACATSDECAPGYVCDPSHACVPPRSTFVDDACSVSHTHSTPTPSPIEPAVFLLAALAAFRRRARSS